MMLKQQDIHGQRRLILTQTLNLSQKLTQIMEHVRKYKLQNDETPRYNKRGNLDELFPYDILHSR